jgi:hypothetical protein
MAGKNRLHCLSVDLPPFFYMGGGCGDAHITLVVLYEFSFFSVAFTNNPPIGVDLKSFHFFLWFLSLYLLLLFLLLLCRHFWFAGSVHNKQDNMRFLRCDGHSLSGTGYAFR